MKLTLLPPPDSSARRGSIIVYAVIFLVLLQAFGDLYLTLVAGLTPNWGTVVRIIVTLLLAYGLYLGRMWARMLLIVLGMVGFAFLLAAIISRPWDGITTFASFAAVLYLAIVAVLAFSPAVRAYETWRQSNSAESG